MLIVKVPINRINIVPHKRTFHILKHFHYPLNHFYSTLVIIGNTLKSNINKILLKSSISFLKIMNFDIIQNWAKACSLGCS